MYRNRTMVGMLTTYQLPSVQQEPLYSLSMTTRGYCGHALHWVYSEDQF